MIDFDTYFDLRKVGGGGVCQICSIKNPRKNGYIEIRPNPLTKILFYTRKKGGPCFSKSERKWKNPILTKKCFYTSKKWHWG